MGVALSLVFANFGAAYGTAKSSIGISNMGVVQPEKIFKALIPIIMAGILGIYGLIVSVLLTSKTKEASTSLQGFKFLASGLCCGLSALASGLAIGIGGEAGVRAYA